MAAQVSDHLDRQPGERANTRSGASSGSFAELMQCTALQGTPDMASPALAGAWADAILSYWQHGMACGAIDAASPLYLIDFAPAGGLLAWRLLNALQERLARHELAARPCLVACCEHHSDADALLHHPGLNGFVQRGWLDAAVFDAESDSALTLRHQKLSVLAAANPAVLLALGHFAALPAGLMAVHYGELLDSTVALSRAEGAQDLDLSYDWPPCSTAATETPQIAALLAYYRTHFHSAALLLPRTALRMLERMQRISGGRYLLLAADAGVCDEQAIRLGAMMPPEHWHACGNQVPVNFHALALAQRAGGATVWNRQLAQDGVVLHAAWCGDGAATGMQQLYPMLEAAHPDQEAALRRVMRAILPASGSDPGAVLALIRQSSHDPAMLMAALDALIDSPPALSDCARREWRSALAGVWQNYLPPVCDDGFACGLAQLAMQLGFLDLAKDCLRSALHYYGEDAYALYLLAWCESRTGGSREALSTLLHALPLAPDYEAARRLQAELSERLQRWQHLLAFRPGLTADGPLRIEPLGPEHAVDLRFQFRDEQIGVMTRLPAIESLEQAQAWIASETSVAGRHAYAAVHERWGFVGIVAAHCAQQAAYFYFWIGSDYQGCGFGQSAARLLFAQLRAAGLNEIYTSVEQVNLCSRHVLHKLGFLRIDIRTAPPEDNQEFYYFGGKINKDEMAKGLLRLCIEIGSPVSLI